MAQNQTSAAYPPLNHDDQGRTVLVSIWILSILSLTFLVLRLFCKFKGRRGLWWDDYLMVLSWVSHCAVPTCNWGAVLTTHLV